MIVIKPLRSRSYRATLGAVVGSLRIARDAGQHDIVVDLINCQTALEQLINVGVLTRDPRRNGPFICINDGEV